MYIYIYIYIPSSSSQSSSSSSLSSSPSSSSVLLIQFHLEGIHRERPKHLVFDRWNNHCPWHHAQKWSRNDWWDCIGQSKNPRHSIDVIYETGALRNLSLKQHSMAIYYTFEILTCVCFDSYSLIIPLLNYEYGWVITAQCSCVCNYLSIYTYPDAGLVNLS